MKYYFLVFFYCTTLTLLNAQVTDVTAPSDPYFEQVTRLLAVDEDREDSIRIYLQLARNSYPPAERWPQFTRQLLDHFRPIYAAGYFDLCDELVEQETALTPGRAARHPEVYTQLLYESGRLYYIAKQYPESIRFLQQSLRFRQQHRITPDVNHSNDYLLLGLNYRAQFDFSNALLQLEKALEITLMLGDPQLESQSRIYNTLGITCMDIGLLGKAARYLDQALQIREQLFGEQHPGTALIYYNSGALLEEKGEFQKAILYLKKAANAFPENSEGYGNTLNLLGVVYTHLGATTEAMGYYQLALEHFQRAGEAELIGRVYKNLAGIAVSERQYADALRYEHAAIDQFRQVLSADDPEIANSLTNLGLTFLEMEQLDSSIFYQLAAIRMLQENPQLQRELANVEVNLGDAYLMDAQWEAAQTTYHKALSTQQQFYQSRHPLLAHTYNGLSKIALAGRNYPLALQQVQQALIVNHRYFHAEAPAVSPDATGYLRYEYFFESLLLKARILAEQAPEEPAQLQLAYQQYQIADTVLAHQRDQLTAREDKIKLAENVQRLSQEAIAGALHLQQLTGRESYLEQAFYFAEKSKAGVLLQSITTNHAKQFAGIPDSLIAREEQLQSDINYYSLKLAEQPDSAQTLLFQLELLEARQAYKDLLAGFEQNFPVYYALRYANETPRAKAVQFGLPDHTALISYFTGDSLLHIFYLDHDHFQHYSSPLGHSFAKQLNAYRKGITRQLDEIYLGLARDLYQQLFPFDLPEGIERLVLVPDGQLTTIPFEALLSSEIATDAAADFTELPYLVRDYDISYAPSAALYHQINSQASTRIENTQGGLLAYAPVFSEKPAPPNATRGLPDLAEEDLEQGPLSRGGKYILPLPGTAHELESISKVFTDSGLPVQTYTYQDATENRIKGPEHGQCRYLHIATHGFINEEFPDLSGLLFYPDSTETEDHILHSGEVYSLKLKAELVVLSACETGMGRINTGEGILGLSRAFLYAGAQNLMVSLWKVDDRATADLMTFFYQQHLSGGQQSGFAEALRQAKLELVASQAFSRPYYWSSFVLIGQ